MQKTKVNNRFNIYSEQGTLKEIILGNPQDFVEGEKINESMKKYYGTPNSPMRKKIIIEYNVLLKILQKNNVNVYFPASSKEVPQQLAPRDIGFVIGNTFVVSNMKWQSRKNEIRSVKEILSKFNGNIINTPTEVLLEGGNILIDRNKIFVGIGLRTTSNAVQFLEAHFGKQYKIYPLLLNTTEEIIHLDAVFNLIGGHYAIFYKNGLQKIPRIIEQYNLIEVTLQEKNNGACNLLSIDSNTVIIRNNLERIENLLKETGFRVYVANWNETKKTGTVGPRCATLPLVRNSI